MPKDYAKFVPPKSRASQRRAGSKRVVILSIFLGFFVITIAAGGYLYSKKFFGGGSYLSTHLTKWFHHQKSNALTSTKPVKKTTVALQNTLPPPVRFDFYSELPSMQIANPPAGHANKENQRGE